MPRGILASAEYIKGEASICFTKSHCLKYAEPEYKCGERTYFAQSHAGDLSLLDTLGYQDALHKKRVFAVVLLRTFLFSQTGLYAPFLAT